MLYAKFAFVSFENQAHKIGYKEKESFFILKHTTF
jgi:hypothetical protein